MSGCSQVGLSRRLVEIIQTKPIKYTKVKVIRLNPVQIHPFDSVFFDQDRPILRHRVDEFYRTSKKPFELPSDRG